MGTRIKALLKPQLLAFVFAMAIVPLMFLVVRHAADQLADSRLWVEHTYNTLSRMEQLRSNMETVETARRGFYITRQEQYLQPYRIAKDEMLENLDALQSMVADNAAQRERLQQIRPVVLSLVALANRDFETRQQDLDRSRNVMSQAKILIDQGRRLIDEMQQSERTLLVKRTLELDNRQRDLQWMMLVMGIGFFLLLLFSFYTILRENVRRRQVEQGLRESQALNDVAVHNLSLMHDMTSLLQSCADVSESLEVIQQFASRLFPTGGGVLYLFRESRNQLIAAMNWGAPADSKEIFQPDDCWALRRGEPHKLDHKQHSLACNHMEHTTGIVSLCMPVMAKGNVLGILYLQRQPDDLLSEVEYRLAATMASQIALALSNIKLRETLRDLSVRDPLTGLFNRRYMEESLQREIATAKRKERELGLAMLDIDHFKKFNDTFGHDAGDLLLREVGELLMQRSRAGDIACRFGGEEFVMIYPEASPEIVIRLAEELRQAIHDMQVQHFGRSLGQVTASLGLAFFPQHGQSTAALLRAADKALYEAKGAGRNFVQVAEVPEDWT
jgi:diguanylate cyclase (GGDEF)-like protein